jgi:hypothetical protein
MLTLALQLLYAGANKLEIVGSAGAHSVSLQVAFKRHWAMSGSKAIECRAHHRFLIQFAALTCCSAQPAIASPISRPVSSWIK